MPKSRNFGNYRQNLNIFIGNSTKIEIMSPRNTISNFGIECQRKTTGIIGLIPQSPTPLGLGYEITCQDYGR